MRRHRFLLWFTTLFFAAVSTVASFIFVEVTLRMLGYPSRILEFSPSGIPGYAFMSPNQDYIRSGSKHVPLHRVHINSIGLRGPEVNPDRMWTIVALGDSFTFGNGVDFEETYVYVLKKRLNEQFGPGIEVINGGYEGANIDHELVVFERQGLPLRPNVVTLQFFPNDVTGLVYREQGARVYQPIEFPLKGYVRHTAMYGLLHRLKLNWMIGKVDRELGGEFTRLTFREGEFYSPALSTMLQKTWEVYFQYLEKLVDRTRQEGIPLVVIIIPDNYQVARPHLLPVPQEKIRAFAQRNDVPVVDPLPTFRFLAAAGETLYIPEDAHLNPRGHAVVADLLRNTLIENNIAYRPER